MLRALMEKGQSSVRLFTLNAKRNTSIGDIQHYISRSRAALTASTIGNHGYNVIREHESISVHKMTQKRSLEYDVIKDPRSPDTRREPYPEAHSAI